MATTRESVAAYRQVLASQGADAFRLRLTTPEARALADELADGEARDADALAAAKLRWDAIAAKPAPDPTDIEGGAAFYAEVTAAANQFWEAFEGQVVEGVEIIRKR